MQAVVALRILRFSPCVNLLHVCRVLDDQHSYLQLYRSIKSKTQRVDQQDHHQQRPLER